MQTSLHPVELDALRVAVSGDVVAPGDQGYDLRRRTFTADGTPAVVVRCRMPQDVRRAVLFGREHALAISVRSGGHGSTGFATNDGGLVIDLSTMNSVDLVDHRRRLVRIDAGATWARVSSARSGTADTRPMRGAGAETDAAHGGRRHCFSSGGGLFGWWG